MNNTWPWTDVGLEWIIYLRRPQVGMQAGRQVGLFRNGKIAPQYILFRRRARGLLLHTRYDYFITAHSCRGAAVAFACLYRVFRRPQSYKTYRPTPLSNILVNFRIFDRTWNSRHETVEYFVHLFRIAIVSEHWFRI